MKDWTSKTAVILASGPSLTAMDCMRVEAAGLPTVAVNCTFRLAPWADIVYMGDMLAVKTYAQEVAKKTNGRTECWTVFDQPFWKRVKCVNHEGLGHGYVHGGGNSGYQAINLAYLFGSRDILLLGFDMGLGDNGEKHWHPDHPKGLVQAQPFKEWIHRFDKLADDLKAEGVRVTNCSRRTALTCFPRGDLIEELRCRLPTC